MFGNAVQFIAKFLYSSSVLRESRAKLAPWGRVYFQDTRLFGRIILKLILE
jgi:hypothetical protein